MAPIKDRSFLCEKIIKIAVRKGKRLDQTKGLLLFNLNWWPGRFADIKIGQLRHFRQLYFCMDGNSF